MSPEQWESSELTVKVDVYAFGVLLNELIVGVAPWKGLASPMAIGFRVCKGERPVTAQPGVEEGEHCERLQQIPTTAHLCAHRQGIHTSRGHPRHE